MRMTVVLGLIALAGCAGGELEVETPPLVPCGDVDDDGVCDDVDVCDGDDATGDTDSDGICDDGDVCLGDDATGDADLDGICDDADVCTGDDAVGDADLDGVCDDTDICEGDDATSDADSDGICDGTDLCFGDNATGDADGDGRCADVDSCEDRFNPNDEPICNVWFVSADATGAGDGTSWEDAFVHPVDALAIAQAGEQIWVAEGTYGPAVEGQAFALDLVEDVALFGGFDGTELDLLDRAGTFDDTIITGDFLGNDDVSDPDGTMTDNAHQLVRTSVDAVLDGFWLESAYAPSDELSGIGVQHNARGNFTIRNTTFSNIRSNGSRGILFLNSRDPGTVLEDVAVIDSTGTAVVGFSGGMDIVGFTVRGVDIGVANFGSGTIVGAHWSILTNQRAVGNSGGSITLSNAALWREDNGAPVISNGGSVSITGSCANQELSGAVHLDGTTDELGFPFVEAGNRLFLAQGISASFTSACVDAGDVAVHADPDQRSTAVDGTIDAGTVDAGAAYLVP